MQQHGKLLCDGSHKTVGFQDQYEARDLLPPIPKL